MRMTAADLERVCAAVELSETTGAVLRGRYVDGQSDREIAAALSVSLVTVRTCVHRARRKIARAQGVDDLARLLLAHLEQAGGEAEAAEDEGLSVSEEARALREAMGRLNCNPPTPVYDSDNPERAEVVSIHGHRVTLEDFREIVARSRRRRRAEERRR